jgi:hypothetical protein
MSLCHIPHVIGNVWGIPENSPKDDPEHKWVIRGDEKVWRALCNQNLETPMTDFFVYPIMSIWQESKREDANLCPDCLAIEANQYFPV